MTEANESALLDGLRRRLWVERAVFTTLLLILAAGYLIPAGDEGSSAAPSAARPDPERAAIIVDGRVLAAADSEAEARAALDRVKAHYAADVANLAEEPQFREDVKIALRPVPRKLYRSEPEEVAELLLSQGSARTHTVGPGDTAWKVAQRAGLTLERLAALNPGRNLDRLAIGDTLRLGPGSAEAGLTVVTRELRTVRQSVPPPVIRVTSRKLYRGKTLVRLPGSSGLRESRELRTYENGVLVDRQVQSVRLLRAPRLRKLVIGALPRP